MWWKMYTNSEKLAARTCAKLLKRLQNLKISNIFKIWNRISRLLANNKLVTKLSYK